MTMTEWHEHKSVSMDARYNLRHTNYYDAQGPNINFEYSFLTNDLFVQD